MLRKLLFLTFLCTVFAVLADDRYNFYMISDTHFGRASSFPKKWDGPKKYRIPPRPNRADTAMPVYEAIFKDISKKADAKTKFLLECGDFVEGAAINGDIHKQELQFAIDFIYKHVKIPIFHVRGNHDNYGPGGDEAFNSTMLPVIAKRAGKKEMKYANYAFPCGKDYFIVLDYLTQSNWKGFLKETLASFKKPPRYLFVAIHTPFISHWNPVITGEICDLLLPYNTILLSGHIHCNSIIKYTKNGKSLMQVTTSLQLPERPKGTSVCKKHRQTLEQYKTGTLKRVKNPRIRKAMEKWMPCVTEFTLVQGTGYLKFDVSDSGVDAYFQGSNLASKPYKVSIIDNTKK